jgi:outer membrane protein
MKKLICYTFLLSLNLFAQNNNSTFITFEEAIQTALSQNNQLKASEYEYKKAQWDHYQSYFNLLPRIEFNTRYMWIDDSTYALRDFSRYFSGSPSEPAPGSEGAPNFDIPQTVFQNSFYSSFNVSMSIFNWQIINGISIASKAKNAAESNKISTLENTILQVIISYLDVMYHRDVLKLQKDFLELSQLNYDKALRLEKAGRYSKADVLRLKVELQQQKSMVENSISNFKRARMNLKKNINFDMNQPIQTETTLPTGIQNIKSVYFSKNAEEIAALININREKLIDVNSALKAAKNQTELSRLSYLGTFETYMPNVNLTYEYGWRENDTPGLDDYSPQTFMVNLSIPIFSGFQDFSKQKSSWYEQKKNEELFEDQLKNTRLLLTDAANRINNLKTQLELDEASVELAEHNYQILEKQREKGLISNLEYLDVLLNRQNTKLAKIKNQFDYIVSVVELNYLLGTINAVIELKKN